MNRTNVRCPGGCIKVDDKGKKISDGFLLDVNENSGKLLCDTVGCKFAYIDEHKREIWCGDEMPISVLNGGPNAII